MHRIRVTAEVLLRAKHLAAVLTAELALLVVGIVVHLVSLRMRCLLELLSASFARIHALAFSLVFVQLVAPKQNKTFKNLQNNVQNETNERLYVADSFSAN